MHVHPPFLYMYTPPNTVSLRGCATNSQPYQRANPSTKKVAPGAILSTTNEPTYNYTHHIHHIASIDLQPPLDGLSGVTLGDLLSSYLAVAEVAGQLLRGGGRRRRRLPQRPIGRSLQRQTSYSV